MSDYASSGSVDAAAATNLTQPGEVVEKRRTTLNVERPHILGADGKRVIDPPVPNLLKPLFHLFIGQYLFEADEFIQTIRKFGIFIFVVGGGCTGLTVGTWHGFKFYEDQQRVPDLVLGILCLLLVVITVICYVDLRISRVATDRVVFVLMASTGVVWSVSHFCSTTYSHRPVNIALVLIGMVLDSPGQLWFAMLYTVLTVISTHNDSYMMHSEGGGEVNEHSATLLLLFPGTRKVLSGWELVVMGNMGSSICVLSMIAALFQTRESKRQVRVAKKSAILGTKVVAELRRYNTDRVLKLVEEARQDAEADRDQIESFEALVGNLEQYRPFLPNYLFLTADLSTRELGDGDDEGSLRIEELLSADGIFSARSSVVQTSRRGSRVSCTGNTKINKHNNDIILRKASGEGRCVSPPPPMNTTTTGSGHNTNFRGVVSYAQVEVRCNEWFSLKLSNKNAVDQRNMQSTFTDALFDIANITKGSIHSMVGDRVHLSWNATHRAVQPEAKAATFLLKLKEAMSNKIAGLNIAAACCSGIAEVHSIFSASTKQQAFYIDAPWLPALQCCYDLATQHQTLVVDSNTATGSEYAAVARGVDCVKYQPIVAFLEDGSPAMDVALRPKGLAEVSSLFLQTSVDWANTRYSTLTGQQSGVLQRNLNPQQPENRPRGPEGVASSASRSTESVTLVFELLQLKQAQEEDEWMYQLQKEEEGGDPRGTAMVTQALHLAVQGRLGDSLQMMDQYGSIGAPNSPRRKRAAADGHRERGDSCPEGWGPYCGIDPKRLTDYLHISLGLRTLPPDAPPFHTPGKVIL